MEIKNIINRKNFKTKKPDECRDWLIANGYIYNKVFGWERIEIIERFRLNPEMTGVPYVLKPKSIEINSGMQTIQDEFGNKRKVKVSGGWEKHPTEKDWSPSDNWLEYTKWKQAKMAVQKIADSVPAPIELPF